MDIKELEKKFEDANKNTLNILEKVEVFKNHTTDEINFVAKQAVESAKMEILFSELAGIPDCKLSKLAQKIKSNPEIDHMGEYVIIQKPVNGKPHSQSRRTWLVMQTIPMDECELRIEVARLKQSGGSKSKTKKEQIEEFEL